MLEQVHELSETLFKVQAGKLEDFEIGDEYYDELADNEYSCGEEDYLYEEDCLDGIGGAAAAATGRGRHAVAKKPSLAAEGGVQEEISRGLVTSSGKF